MIKPMRCLAVITLALQVLTGCQTIDSAADFKHFRPLAAQGDAKAQYWLGDMYRDGEDVVQDLVMAYVWLNVSATDGGSGAKEARDNVLARLNASERKLALKLFKRCFKKPARCPDIATTSASASPR